MRRTETFFLAGLLVGFSHLVSTVYGEGPVTLPVVPEVPTPAEETKVRVVSWNLEWYPGLKPQPTLEAEVEAERNLIASMPSLGADIICAQEVVSERSLIRAIEAAPGLKMNLISDFANASQELAIASRFPVIEKGAVPFTANGEVKPPRGFVYAALDTGEGDILVVYCVHLKSNRGGDNVANFASRQESAIQLTKHALETVDRLKADGQQRRVSVLVAGDFNSDPANGKWEGDGTWSVFAKAGFKWGWDGVPLEERNSWVGDDRFEPTCFDHLMFLARDGLTAGKSHLLAPAVAAGDHLPVALELVW